MKYKVFSRLKNREKSEEKISWASKLENNFNVEFFLNLHFVPESISLNMLTNIGTHYTV